MRRVVFALAIAALAVPAAAAPNTKDGKCGKKSDLIRSTVEQVEQAIRLECTYSIRGVVDRTCTFRDRMPESKFAAVARALGRGCDHQKPAIAKACATGLGKLKIAGSGKMLARLIAPRGKVTDERVAVHVAAIEAAGRIHDRCSVPALEKLLRHPRIELATAAGRAFGGYRWIDDEPRFALGRKLARAIGALEARIRTTRDEVKRKHFTKVATAIDEGLRAMFDVEKSKDAAAWTKWLKRQAKADA